MMGSTEAPGDVFLGTLLRGPRENCLRVSVLDELTHVKERGEIAHARSLLHRVGDDGDGVLALELADELLDARGGDGVERGRRLPVLIQVNVSGEAQKHGVAPGALSALVEAVAELPGLALDGVMSIGAEVERAEAARRWFVATRELRDRAARETGRSMAVRAAG